MATSPSPQKLELSRPVTVALASVGSVVAALVVSKVWGPGTLIGAAVTPVIITLVAEALRKPVATVVVRTPTGTEIHEVGTARPRTPDPSHEPTIVSGPERVQRPRRGPLLAALATGLVAFAIGAFVLTSTELVLGDSLASDSPTTIFSKRAEPARPAPATTTEEEPAPTTPTVTETVPAPATPPSPVPEEEPAPVPPAGTTGPTGPTIP